MRGDFVKYHIVQVNEKIKDISKKYNISLEEIVKFNRHINNIDSIVPGMKIRLPILSDEVNDELKENFLDIDKYYPKIEDFKDVKIEKKNVDNSETNEYVDTENSEEIPTTLNQTGEKVEINPQQTYNPYSYQGYPPQGYQQPNFQGYPQPYSQQPNFQGYPQAYSQQPNFQGYPQPYPQQPNFQGYPQPYSQQPNLQGYQQPYQKRENNELSSEAKESNLINQPALQIEPNPPIDLTLPNMKEECSNEDPKIFEQPAFCNPILLEDNKPIKKNDTEYHPSGEYQPYANFFLNPLYNPPYPCSKPIEEIDQFNFDVANIAFVEEEKPFSYDEDVKEIKLDLRDFIKKHTTIKKKRDSLDLL